MLMKEAEMSRMGEPELSKSSTGSPKRAASGVQDGYNEDSADCFAQ